MSAFAQSLSSALMAAPSFLALPVEREFVPTAMVNFAANNWPLVISIVVFYMAFISIGRVVMSNNFVKPFDLRLPLAGWNAFLCLFSFIGMCKTVGEELISKTIVEINISPAILPSSFSNRCHIWWDPS